MKKCYDEKYWEIINNHKVSQKAEYFKKFVLDFMNTRDFKNYVSNLVLYTTFEKPNAFWVFMTWPLCSGMRYAFAVRVTLLLTIRS